jgi:hypothetical protein
VKVAWHFSARGKTKEEVRPGGTAEGLVNCQRYLFANCRLCLLRNSAPEHGMEPLQWVFERDHASAGDAGSQSFRCGGTALFL